MEAPIRRHLGLGVVLNLDHRPLSRPQLCPVELGSAFGRRLRRRSLESDPHFVDVEDLLGRGGAHAYAARHALHEVLDLEAVQRLSHGCTALTELGGERVLGVELGVVGNAVFTPASGPDMESYASRYGGAVLYPTPLAAAATLTVFHPQSFRAFASAVFIDPKSGKQDFGQWMFFGLGQALVGSAVTVDTAP